MCSEYGMIYTPSVKFNSQVQFWIWAYCVYQHTCHTQIRNKCYIRFLLPFVKTSERNSCSFTLIDTVPKTKYTSKTMTNYFIVVSFCISPPEWGFLMTIYNNLLSAPSKILMKEGDSLLRRDIVLFFSFFPSFFKFG